MSVDRVVNFVVLGGLIAIAIYGVAPGVAQELSPKYGVTEVVAAGQSTAVAAERSVPTLGRFELLGVPHGHALGLGSWLLLAAVLTVLAAGLWEEFRSENVLGILATVMTSAAFVAGPWERDVSAASALRWTCALALAAGSLPIWFRGPLSRIAKNFNWPGFEARSVGLASESRSLVLVLSLAPLVAMAGYCAVAAVARVSLPTGTYQLWYVLLIAAAIGCGAATAIHFALGGGPRRAALLLAIVAAAPVCALSAFMVTASLRQSPILGPDPSSFFAQIGTAASYSLPVLVTAVVLLGHAIRERSARFAFVSGLLFNAAATSGYLLIIARGARLDVEHWIRLAQINAAVSAIYALAWFIARRRSEPAGTHSGGVLFATQSMLGAAFVAMAVAPLSLMFWADPWANPNYLAAADGGGWSAFGLALAALVACSRTGIRQMSRSVAVPAVWVAGTLLAFAASRWDTGNWAGFHVWMIVNLAIAWSVLGFGLWLREPGAKFGVWGSLIVGLVVMLALRSAVGDPQAPWWAVGSLAVLCVWSASFAGLVRQRAALYAAAILVNLAIAIWWFDSSWSLVSSFGPMAWSFFALNTLAAGLAAVIWTAIEVLAIRPFKRPVGIECHRVVATGGLLVVALHVGIGLLLDAFGEAQPADTWLDWLAWSGVAAAVVASLWDERARFRIAACYVLGLLAVGTALDQFNVPPRLLGWNVAMLLAAWSVGTSYLWSRRRGLTEIAAAVRMPRGPDTPTAGLIWLAPANLALAIGVVGLALWVDLTFFDELSLRLLSAKAAVAQALAVGLLARGERRSPLQYTALSLGAVGAVIWGWAWLEPGSTGILLDRAVVVIAALAATIALYGLGLAKLAPRAGEWTRAALRLVPVLAVLAAASIVVVIGMEIVYWLNDGAVPMSPTGIATVIAALAGLISAALAAAVLPGRDPLGLSERGRMAYVYAAEVVGGLLFLHIRLTMPWLFHGWFTRYWPLVVMAVAFAGVGFGEVFRRQRQRVLAEPLERTGVFLPLLPVLGFAVLPSLVDYSVLLLSVAVLYTGMAATRKSFVYSVLAALAANGSLWSLLWDVRGLRFLEHPQLWLIPPALCVLVAAWLNRDRLSAGQMATIRYAASTTIYVSSTADIFLNGVAQAPWLPVVLAGISLVGIFAGILLRVRGFLFLGTAFLSVALFTIIWHAAVDLEQTWLWFASGIAVGILIIALFAVFEQKRQEVLRLVDDLKRWQA